MINIITYDEKEYSSNSIFINFATLGGIVNILKDKLKEHVTNIKGARIGLIGVDEMYAHLTTTDIKNLEYEKKKKICHNLMANFYPIEWNIFLDLEYIKLKRENALVNCKLPSSSAFPLS